MTMVYARIADRTVADEYFSVTEKVEALYHQQQATQLPAEAEGTQMRELRAEVHRRMLGSGYCARLVELDCHFESICESCSPAKVFPLVGPGLPWTENTMVAHTVISEGAAAADQPRPARRIHRPSSAVPAIFSATHPDPLRALVETFSHAVATFNEDRKDLLRELRQRHLDRSH